MGLKIIALSYFPLTHYVFLLLWSLFQLGSMSVITILHYTKYASTDEFGNCTVYNRTLDIIVAAAFILVLTDFIVFVLYSVKEFYKRCIAPPNQERASVSIVIKGWRVIFRLWRKYGDIPRLIMTEALLYTIFSLEIRCSSSSTMIQELIQLIIVPGVLFICLCIQIAFACIVLFSVCCKCKPNIAFNWQMVGFLLVFILNFILQRSYEAFVLSSTELIQMPLLSICGYFVPVLGIVTFFILTHGLLKAIFIKTFKQFLTNLQKRSNVQNRERIQSVLDKFEYNTLCQLQSTKVIKEYVLPNPLLGVLMLPFLVFLALSFYTFCQEGSTQPRCRIGLSLGLVFNVWYIPFTIGWIISILIYPFNVLLSYCKRQ